MSFRKNNLTDLEKLIRITADYMRENNIHNLDGGYRRKNNHFDNILEKYFQSKYPATASLNLYIMWRRNDKNFKTRVLEILFPRKMELQEIDIDSVNWKNLEVCVSENQRPKFLSSSNIIFKRLFLKFGIKCSLKIKANSFSISQKKIPGRKFWNGIFECELCKKIYKAFIQDKPSPLEPIKLIIDKSNDCSGERKIQKRRLCGDERIRIQNEVALKGTMNFRSEAVLDGLLYFNIFL